METVELKVEGMDCQGCVKSVTRMLSGVAGVENVDVSLEEGRARVTYDPAKAGVADMKRAVERAGYKAPRSPRGRSTLHRLHGQGRHGLCHAAHGERRRIHLPRLPARASRCRRGLG